MRILGIGDSGDLGDMYWRLARAGHEVSMYIGDPASQDVFDGLVRRVADWRTELDAVRGAGAEGLIVFESATHGGWQDRLRADGFRVVGGSAYGDRLEADREFGQAEMQRAGMRIAVSHRFRSLDDAIHHLEHHPGRFVFKNNGANALRTRNYIGQLEHGSDMLAFLRLARDRLPPDAKGADFVLMAHVSGVEVGVGAYFNGQRFLQPALLDWEHKRFFAQDLGELTGEMGTIVSYQGAERLFAQTLARMEQPLRAAGHQGYVNLNLIVNEEGIWPLEFTSRFGYPGFAICDALHEERWDSILRKMTEPSSSSLQVRPGFACGVVLTVPPFPYHFGYEAISKGMPICLRDTATAADRDALHLGEVADVHGQWVAAGCTGYLGVATGIGANIEDARQAAYHAARQVVVPNLRYRSDIGERVAQHDLTALRTWGWLDG